MIRIISCWSQVLPCQRRNDSLLCIIILVYLSWSNKYKGTSIQNWYTWKRWDPLWHIWLSPFTRVEKTHLFQKDPPIWSLLSVVKSFALQYLWSVTYFHWYTYLRTGWAPIKFLNAHDVTFIKSSELILPFFLEEETHLMHSNCCASPSFLNDSLATWTIDKHSITISREIVNHAIANAVIWVDFAVVGHTWSITTKQYYECCSVLSWS